MSVTARNPADDDSQGVPLTMIQEFARYWAADYDWRRCEARLNSLPHFITEIDGLGIHFIHVRSGHDHALPLIVSTASDHFTNNGASSPPDRCGPLSPRRHPRRRCPHP